MIDIETPLSDKTLGLLLKKQKASEFETEYVDLKIKIQKGEYTTTFYRKCTYQLLFIRNISKES